jgi:hypothetical protein
MMCQSDSRYSETPEYVFKGMTSGPDKAAKEHISSMTSCRKNVKNGKSPNEQYLRKSQSLRVIGQYNYNHHEGNSEKGKQGEVSNTFKYVNKTLSNS